MRRFIFPMTWSCCLWLLLFPLSVFDNKTHAESSLKLEKKISRDILKKVEAGKGSEFVRVIIQPANAWDLSSDFTRELAGGSNIRKFKNFSLRVVTLPANAAVALATRNDVSYVSLNQDIRPMGHLSHTTGTDQVRSSGGGSSS